MTGRMRGWRPDLALARLTAALEEEILAAPEADLDLRRDEDAPVERARAAVAEALARAATAGFPPPGSGRALRRE
ncbi:hypothetical protein [Methylobacterium sp. JK268]